MSYLLLSKNVKIMTYRSLLVTAVLLGCDIWRATLGEELGVGVFEKRVLRGIFGPRRKDVTEKWRRKQNENFHCLYSSLDIILYFIILCYIMLCYVTLCYVLLYYIMIWAGHVARRGERRDA